MKNVYEVLRQKELEVSRVVREVEALRVAAPLLSDADEANSDALAAPESPSEANSASQLDQFDNQDRARRLP